MEQKMTTATVERRQFKAHPKFIKDAMTRQAGSVEKAILEGVMNAIEAGATSVSICFNENKAKPNELGASLVIMDDGKGISSAEEIELFFETLGQPHDEEENKIWAQFRMGRGQLFSFGKNTWRTSQFRMEVNLEELGLDYDLHQGLEEYDGCEITIDLYKNPIGTYTYRTIDTLRERIATLVRFMPKPIYFNGQQINTPPENCSWDSETDDAYYLFGAGIDLKIYNLGALTKTLDLATAGTCGVIVSKKQLKVNFARNDIQHDCSVFPRIQKVITDNRIKKNRQQNRISSEHERTSTLLDLRDGAQDYRDIKTLGLLRDTSGRLYTLDAIRKNRMPWTFAERGDRRADNLLQAGLALILDDCVLSELGYADNPALFFRWLAERSGYGDKFSKYLFNEKMDKAWKPLELMYRKFNDLTSGMSNTHTFIPENKQTTPEKRMLRIISKYDWLGRTVTIGASGTAAAWTDGKSYIALDRRFLKRVSSASSYCTTELVMTMIHEMSHDDDDRGSHVHDEEFYRRFHDLCLQRHSPARLISDMYYQMRQARIDEKVDKETDRQKKAEKKQADKLAARTKTPISTDIENQFEEEEFVEEFELEGEVA